MGVVSRLSRKLHIAVSDQPDWSGRGDDSTNIFRIHEAKGDGPWRLVDENPCRKGRVLIHGAAGRDRSAIGEWLGDLYGVEPLVLEVERPDPEHVLAHADDIDLAYIEAEMIGGAEEVVDYCLALRAAAPLLPIVLYMAGVAVSDFSTHRAAICDVTLKRPLTRTAVALSVGAATENNVLYAERRLDPDDG